MASKRTIAPETPIRSFPTPNVDDLVVVVDVDSRLPGYKPLEYGTLHPDQTRFPNAKLVYQEPIDGGDQFVRRIYATDRANQDAYNYAIKYSSGSVHHPIYIRSYVEPRGSYTPLPDGSADSVFTEAFLVDEEVTPVEGELNSLYFRVTRVFETLPGPPLTSFETNEAGQKVTVTTQRKSYANYSLPAASATSSPSAQAEDTGVITEQIRSVPEVFTRKQFSAERPDPLPPKFRTAVPDVETSEITEGTANQPTLDVPEELSASETQETLFLKRVNRRLRPEPDYPVTFAESTRTNSGQLAATTSTLQNFLQEADTGPLVESSEVTDLGDGRSIKVTTAVDYLFGQSSFTKAREDLVPNKFRNPSESVTEVTQAGTAALHLPSEALEHTEQQVTVDTKRVRTRTRLQNPAVNLSGGVEYTSDLGGGYASVTEEYSHTLPQAPTTDGFGVISDSLENTGDGYVRRKVVLPPEKFDLAEFDEDGTPLTAETMPPLRGQDYDEELDLTIPYTQVVARPTTTRVVEGPRRRSTPRDKDHTLVVKYDVKDVQDSLDTYFWQMPDMVAVRLPDKLLKAYVVYDSASGTAAGSGFGNTYFYTKKFNSSYRGKIAYDIEEGFSGNIPAIRAVCFLPKESTQPADVLAKLRLHLGNSVLGFFPNARPQAHELLVFGQSADREISESVSFDSGSTSEGISYTSSVDVTNIPATIHGSLKIGDNSESGDVSLIVTPNTLPATQPYEVFPTGRWVYQINASPYKFSYVRVEAVIVDITSEYV